MLTLWCLDYGNNASMSVWSLDSLGLIILIVRKAPESQTRRAD